MNYPDVSFGMMDALRLVGQLGRDGVESLPDKLLVMGEVVKFNLHALGGREAVVIGDPMVSKRLLIDHHDQLLKGTLDFRILRGFLGDALFFGYELDPARLKVAIRRRMIV